LYRMPPPNAVPQGAPYTLPFCVTTGRNLGSVFCSAGSFVRSTSVFSGDRACSSEPELYQKTSCMSPVDSLVLTRLSPSEPPGRVSVFTLMSGLAFSNAATSAAAALTVASPLSTNKVIVVLPEPELELDELPHAAIVTRAVTATAAAASLG